MELAKKIKELRISNGLTQEELGRRIGVKRAAVQKWECGRTQNLKRSTLQKLSEIFGVSPAAFISEEFDEMQSCSPSIVANNNIGERIKKRRIELNMTQTELAKILGYCSRSSINKIEQGQNDLPRSKIEAIAKALECSPAYLMGWEDAPEGKEAAPAVPLHSVTLRPDEAALLGSYNTLNDTGKEKAVEYVTDLAGNKKYTSAEGVGRLSS